MTVRNIKTGRDLLNALKKVENLDSPIEVSVFHHPHNDSEMPTFFGIGCMDELKNVPDNEMNHILITCTDIHIPGTIDELTKDIEYKTAVKFSSGGVISTKTIKKK